VSSVRAITRSALDKVSLELGSLRKNCTYDADVKTFKL